MQTYTTADGVEHPVSDGFLLYPPEWTQDHEDHVLAIWKAGEELHDLDRAFLTAWQNRANLESAWRFLGDGPHYTDHFGPDATLDQVHGQGWSPDTCGCTHHQVYDHHKRGEEGNELRSHRIHKLCDRHASVGHPDRHAEHHERLVRECQHKEAVLNAVTDAHGLEAKDRPTWHYSKEHELVIDTTGHPVLRPEHVNRIVQEQFSHAVVHVR
jgi:hypothetical protein